MKNNERSLFQNGCFVGPAMSVPFMLLASYTFGVGSENIPLWIYIGMQLSYLRFGLEGIVAAIYGENRSPMKCPEEEMYCQFTKPVALIKELGMENSNYYAATALVFMYFVLFKLISFIVLRQRLKRARTSGIVWMVGRFIKRYFTVAH